jgi:hypothetical protein
VLIIVFFCGDADQHLESSTKRTLVENETMVAELAYHTAQVSSERGAASQLNFQRGRAHRRQGRPCRTHGKAAGGADCPHLQRVVWRHTFRLTFRLTHRLGVGVDESD